MNRSARLQSAKSFLPTYSGKNIVRGYARWFGVDLACALVELQILGLELDSTYVERLRATLREKERVGRERNEKRRLALEAADDDEAVADHEPWVTEPWVTEPWVTEP